MVHASLLARTQTTEQRLELAGIHHGVQKELGALVLTVCVCVRVCVCVCVCVRCTKVRTCMRMGVHIYAYARRQARRGRKEHQKETQ
jgi:hypothetical protein